MPQRLDQPTIAVRGIVRPTVAEVDLARVVDNFRAIRERVSPADVMPIVKANAYGHGMVEVARHLAASGARCLGVAVLEEGILLREEGLSLPILVLGGILGDQIPHFLRHDLSLTASSVAKLQQIDEIAGTAGTTARVHLKIDTGMERIGVHYYHAGPFLEAALRSHNCRIEGIYSHFASSDAGDLGAARRQLERFHGVLEFYRQRGLPPPVRHMANSGAILQLPESHLDMVRAGILLYGVYPSAEAARTIVVKPALSWKSRVVYFKVVEAHAPVSYRGSWSSDHRVRIVTVPVGYGDGYMRSLGSRGQVLIRGRRYPVVGHICMDQLMVNIEWNSAYIGDEVVLIGESAGEVIGCEDLAAWAGTIPNEILTNVNTRVPRVYSGGAAGVSSSSGHSKGPT
jgi:alanine racemase